MNSFKYLVGLILAATVCLAQAIPVTADEEGYAGQTVTVILSDDGPVDLFGATIKVVFNPHILTFKGGTPGTIHGVNPLDPLDPGVELAGADPLDALFLLDTTDADAYSFTTSLTYPFPFGANAAAGSLMNLSFEISGTALPGTSTPVSFSCVDFGPGLGCFDYDFPSISAAVTVLQPTTTPIPLPGTLPLLGLGVAALVWVRRRVY